MLGDSSRVCGTSFRVRGFFKLCGRLVHHLSLQCGQIGCYILGQDYEGKLFPSDHLEAAYERTRWSSIVLTTDLYFDERTFRLVTMGLETVSQQGKNTLEVDVLLYRGERLCGVVFTAVHKRDVMQLEERFSIQ